MATVVTQMIGQLGEASDLSGSDLLVLGRGEGPALTVPVGGLKAWLDANGPAGGAAEAAIDARDEAFQARADALDALQQIFDLANGAPDAPSILNKADKSEALLRNLPFASNFPAGLVGNAGVTLNSQVGATAFDTLLINHEMAKASNGLHVLGVALLGCLGGQSVGAAMNGAGTADALVGNRYEDGDGSGVVGNRVGLGAGYGLDGQFSSEAPGAAIRAIKQPSGYTGISGPGPALLVQNLSALGFAIDSVTAAVNTDAVSHRLTRLRGTGGINLDIRTDAGGVRLTELIGLRATVLPGVASGGAGAVAALTGLVGANITGSNQVDAGSFLNQAAGNVSAHGAYCASTGANDNNYGIRATASGGINNFAGRFDGSVWVTAGNIWFPGVPVHADNAAAAATLQPGTLYSTPAGDAKFVLAA